MKNAVFTYFNHQISPEIVSHQRQVISKILSGTDVDFHPLQYNANDGDVYPDQVINYGLNTLFEQGYDNVLILDVDCIPLNVGAITYTFGRASQGTLIGNIQRSHYIENDEHLFIGSSCCCVNKTIFEQLGKPSFGPTARGDIGEELVYLAEDKNIPIEFYIPQSFEHKPYGAESWALRGDMQHYGIGTTFINLDGHPMFYHLFESRTNLHVEKFVNKCKAILDN